jgi:hypothetical protein
MRWGARSGTAHCVGLETLWRSVTRRPLPRDDCASDPPLALILHAPRISLTSGHVRRLKPSSVVLSPNKGGSLLDPRLPEPRSRRLSVSAHGPCNPHHTAAVAQISPSPPEVGATHHPGRGPTVRACCVQNHRMAQHRVTRLSGQLHDLHHGSVNVHGSPQPLF